MISQLLKLFGVNNIIKLVLVFLVFSLSGLIALYASDILTSFLSKFIDNNILILILKIVSIFILYQIVIIITLRLIMTLLNLVVLLVFGAIFIYQISNYIIHQMLLLKILF